MKRALRSWPLDVLAGVAIFAFSLLEVQVRETADGPLAVDLPVITVLGLAVGLRRRAPEATTVAFIVAMIVASFWGTPPPELTAAFISLLLFPYALGAHARGWPAGVAMAGIVVLVPVVDSIVESDVSVDVFPAILSTLSYLAGRLVHSRTRLAAELHEVALREEEEREAKSAHAVGEERRRIAREMHDVVAHSISVMVVQAGGARRVLEKGEADRAIEAAGRIEVTGREALSEMRRLLGVLQPSDDGAAVRAPQPTMGEVDALIDRARRSGLPLEFHEEGERRELPTGVDLAAYRILQEALTNAIKHAEGAPTEVHVRWDEEEIGLVVSDRGAGGADPNGHGESGHGLIGMRERVRLYGGELHAGIREGGGFEVRARLPLGVEDEV